MLYSKSLAVLLTVSLFFKHSAQQSPLRIDITNIQKSKGKVIVEIYKDKSDWLKTPYQKVILSTDESSKTTSFALPNGKYAVSIYQDSNENGKLDQNFLGIPKEPIGFGNNYKPFGKPKFESATIEHNSTAKQQPIKLFSVL